MEINDESREAYNVNGQIKFKTTMLNSSLCDYSDSYLLLKGTVYSTGIAAAPNNSNKKVMFKNCAPITNSISEINNTQVDSAKDIDIVMPMHNLIEYSNNYSNTAISLRQYCKDITALYNNGNIVDFNGTDATESFNSKAKIRGQTENDEEIDNVEIMLPLKYLSNFWRILKMPLNNCVVNLILTWSANCVIVCTDFRSAKMTESYV